VRRACLCEVRVYTPRGAPARVPAGGLTPAALSEIDGTLRHELAHVFIAERTHSVAPPLPHAVLAQHTHGVAPRLLHEALAQYYEGDRVSSKLDFDALSALGDGRLSGVGGFYMEA